MEVISAVRTSATTIAWSPLASAQARLTKKQASPCTPSTPPNPEVSQPHREISECRYQRTVHLLLLAVYQIYQEDFADFPESIFTTNRKFPSPIDERNRRPVPTAIDIAGGLNPACMSQLVSMVLSTASSCHVTTKRPPVIRPRIEPIASVEPFKESLSDT